MIRPIEEVDPMFAELILDIVHKKYRFGIESLYIGNDRIILKEKIQQKIERNDPCPYCLKEGKNLKWKKCKEHNDEA